MVKINFVFFIIIKLIKKKNHIYMKYIHATKNLAGQRTQQH